MSIKNTTKSIYQEIGDIVFTPKKKSTKKRWLVIIVLLLIFGFGTWFLYYRGYLSKFNASTNNSNKVRNKIPENVENITFAISSGYRFNTIQTFSKKSCDIQQSGEDIYTEFFEINGKVGRIKLQSNRVIKDELFNTRIWYTTSNKNLDEFILDDKAHTSYAELGEGRPGNESGVKNGIFDFVGPGIYRLRILCWNSDVTIEIQDSQ